MITQRHLNVWPHIGYSWVYELTQYDGSRWIGKVFLGGVLKFTSQQFDNSLTASLQCSIFIRSNPYYK